jgi:hypothetical protein
MAKITEEIIVIKISQLTKDDVGTQPRATEEVISALTQVAEELVGAGAVVEVEHE